MNGFSGGLIIGLLFTSFVQAEVTNLSLNAESYVLDAATGSLTMEGFSTGGSPGNPQLPERIIHWALPPNARMDSVTLEITGMDAVDVDSACDLPPVPPMMTYGSNHTPIISWGETPAANITNGRNTAVYNQDVFFPETPVTLLPYGQLRKWQFANISFSPFQYNPVTHRLRLIQRIDLTLHYDAIPSLNAPGPDTSALLSDDKMTDRAAELLANFETVSVSYQSVLRADSAVRSSADYAIITTTTISNNLTQLPNLIQHLTHQGHTVQVVTENDYGLLAGQSPNGTAEKIRQWLINNYAVLGIEYVLLIGDPDPDDPSNASDSIGDIPMKMCWPCRTSSSDQESPTDYFYADLTGNWDLDGDGYYGEYSGDMGSGGVDFNAEVLVGRIPLYSGDYAAANTMIRRMIDYETDTNSIVWRRRMLLPMSISNYEREDNDPESYRTDGRNLPKLMINNVLTPCGHSYYVMYEKAGLDYVPNTASYDNASHIGISETNLIAQWNNGYGTVLWWGHGNETAVYRKYWKSDDGDSIPESDEMEWPELTYSSMMTQITSACPAIIYMSSCTCGYPENQSNLGYTALRDQAVAVIAASRVSWYLVGTWSVSSSYADNTGIGYETMRRLISNKSSIAQSLYDAKESMNDGFGNASWMNKMDFNLYGLPSLMLTNITKPSPVFSVSVATPQTTENGGGPVIFNVTGREPVTNNITLQLSFAGSAACGVDYTSGTDAITFPAGSNALSFFLYPVDDASTEGPESIVFNLLPDAAYQRGDSVGYAHILDDEEAVVAPASPTVNSDPDTQNEASDNMDFDLSGGPLTTFDQGGFGSFGQVYLNYDETNLYIGAVGCDPAGTNNALVLFLSMASLTDNAENLWSCSGLPNGLDDLHNMALSPASDIAILIGDEWGDGTYTNFNLESGYNMGQGVFYLNSLFTPVSGATLSQFDGTNSTPAGAADADGNRQTDRWEARIPLTSLNADCVTDLGNVYISGLIFSDAVDGNDRYLSGNFLGASIGCSSGLNDCHNYGFSFVTLTGQLIQVVYSNRSPAVILLAPHSGAEYIQGQAIPFRAAAADAEDGALTNIFWSASIDGPFAQGEEVLSSSLSFGTQTITAGAVDSESVTGAVSVTIVIAADADANRLPDAWEEAYWAEPGTNGAEEDPDADGANNAEEWLAGTDPTSADSLFSTEVQSAPSDPDAFLLQWNARSNRLYSIWVQTNLYDLPMTPLVTNIQPSVSGPIVYTDLVHQAETRLFYRIRVEP